MIYSIQSLIFKLFNFLRSAYNLVTGFTYSYIVGMVPDSPRMHPRPRSSHLGMALLTRGAIALTGHVTPDLVTWMPLGQLKYSN